jgi:hypothetical protein
MLRTTPRPWNSDPGRGAALRVVQSGEVSPLFTTDETVEMQLLQLPPPQITLVREQEATAELSPVRSRTSQPEGCFTQRSIRSQSPLTVVS